MPKATRWRATNSASCTARRIMPAERTPLERRELLIMSAICLKPACGSPISQATAPSSRTSPLAMERVPSLSFRRTMRSALAVPSGSVRGIRNSATPFRPGGPPCIRASTSASFRVGVGAEPLVAVERVGAVRAAARAVTAVAAMSLPAPCSVMNIAP